MKPILPRPLLWTEIKTMDEFLKGDLLTSMLYDIFKNIDGTLFFPHVSAVSLFNELYYQLTRYNYEKPTEEDYLRYYSDIRTNLGYARHTNLVLTMMYHYCRLKDMHFQETPSPFMAAIKKNQIRREYWLFFTRARSTVFYWPEIVPYPQKPCPVAPNDLERRGLEWEKITNQYDLESVKEVLNLWKNAEDKKAVANILRKNMRVNKTIPLHSRNDVSRYLKQVVDNVNGMPVSLEGVVVSETSSEEGGKTYRFTKPKGTDVYTEELKKKDEEMREKYTATDEDIDAIFEDNKSNEERIKGKNKEMNNQESGKAFNAQTGMPCFTSRQMGILMEAVALLTEQPVPGKTTLGEVVEKISGYKATTVNQNMKGAHRELDIEAVASAIESKFPTLAAKVRRL